MNAALCDHTELPVEQCAGACCRPDLVERRFVPVASVGTWRDAEFPGWCACGCSERIETGDDLVLAELEEDTLVAEPRRGWCLVHHTRSAASCH